MKNTTSIKSAKTQRINNQKHTMEIERVQEIASLSNLNGTIPIEFIRSENEQPATTTIHGVTLEVPVIDLSDLDDQKLVASIFEASKDWGIFQVVNHDITSEVISKLQKVGKEFFELPQEEKEAIAKPVGYKGVEGYGTKLQKEVEGKKGWVDHLFHRVWPPSAINYQFWPKNPPSYRFRSLSSSFLLSFLYILERKINSCMCMVWFSCFSLRLKLRGCLDK